MAEEAAKETTPKAAAPEEVKSTGRFKTLAIIGGIMLLEGGGLFLITKMIYQKPEELSAEVLDPKAQLLENIKEHVEISLPEINAFNRRQGRLYMYNIEVSIRVKTIREEDVKNIIEARKGTIFDRLNTVIRSAEVKHLNEPGLGTIRRQFKFELNRVMGDDELILELLIPKFLQSPADL